MSRLKVAVLGCGPAGLLAAHAATRENCEVDIYSKPAKSRIGGAQYLYMPIPGITGSKPDGTCTVYKLGDEAGYATKVYGSADAPTSWGQFADQQVVPVWNMQAAYDYLYTIYGYGVLPENINLNSLVYKGGILETYDLVISCIPRTFMCVTGEHDFHSQDVWISAWQEKKEPPFDNWIEYDGRKETDHYRSSCLFGHAGYEYPVHPEGIGFVKVSKPLDHNCNCWQHWPKVQFMGRYGKWQKGQLIHHAYLGTQEAINDARSY